MFENIKISIKLIGGYLIVLAILAVMAVMSFAGMKTLNDNSNAMYQEHLKPLASLNNAYTLFYFVRGNLYKYVLVPQDREWSKNQIKDELETIDADMEVFRHKKLTNEEQNNLKNLDDQMKLYRKDIDDSMALVNAGKIQKVTTLLVHGGKISKTCDAIDEAFSQLNVVNDKLAEQSYKDSSAMFSRATTLNLIAALIAIALSLMMGFFLSRSITVPLDRCVKMIQEMSLGHLKNRLNIRAKDEVGVLAQNMDRFADELQNVVIGTMKKISEGDLSSQIAAKDSRDEISPALQGTIANLKALIADANLLCQAALDGDLSRRANANSHKGDYRKVIQGFNETLDAVIGPINEAALVLEQVAKRDLTVRVKGDYAGDHAKIKESINLAVDNLDKGLIQVAQNTQTLASASEELSTIGHEMSQNAEKNSSQSNVVSAAAEQVSTNIRMVAAAAEQLNASIKEIAKNAAEAALVAEHAVQSIEITNVTVSKLGDSSAEIGNVVKVITSIAQQTNLLALNATIEAARAGEAGKGFAVVANEVKELAKETAKATEDISLKIETIQGDTKAAVSAISEISGIIKQINEFQASIASAVEEQSATTNEIGRNVTEAAKGSTDIAENITGVAQTARNTASGASDSQKASAELSNLAVGLQKLVAQFKY